MISRKISEIEPHGNARKVQKTHNVTGQHVLCLERYTFSMNQRTKRGRGREDIDIHDYTNYTTVTIQYPKERNGLIALAVAFFVADANFLLSNTTSDLNGGKILFFLAHGLKEWWLSPCSPAVVAGPSATLPSREVLTVNVRD